MTESRAAIAPKARIFLALDTSEVAHAAQLAEALRGEVGGVKIGKELFTAQGPDGVRALAGGQRLFLDLKFHDIPNTVAGAVCSAVHLRPAMLTVHASGGRAMMQAAAEAARAAGLDGAVCSPREIECLRADCGPDFTLVVPGIRPSWAASGDQKRVMTPAEAVAAGADYLVVGRPISAQPDPLAAARRIVGELAEAAETRP